jgi:transposase-like protein
VLVQLARTRGCYPRNTGSSPVHPASFFNLPHLWREPQTGACPRDEPRTGFRNPLSFWLLDPKKARAISVTCHYCRATCKKSGFYGRKKIQRFRCVQCKKTFAEPQSNPLGTMRTDIEIAAKAIQCLIEGCSIRSTERLTGLNRNTIMRLLLVAGEQGTSLMNAKTE